MTETPTRADVLVDALVAEADAAYAAHAEKRIAVLEAFRDAAIARIAVLEEALNKVVATVVTTTPTIGMGVMRVVIYSHCTEALEPKP